MVGARSDYFGHHIGPFPWWRELVTVLVALYKMKDLVPDVEGSAPHPSAVVPSQRLLVLGRTEEGNVAGFV